MQIVMTISRPEFTEPKPRNVKPIRLPQAARSVCDSYTSALGHWGLLELSNVNTAGLDIGLTC